MKRIALSIAALTLLTAARAEETAKSPPPPAQPTDAGKAAIIQPQEAAKEAAKKAALERKFDPQTLIPLTAGELRTLMEAERLNALAAGANAAAAPIMQKINKRLGVDN